MAKKTKKKFNLVGEFYETLLKNAPTPKKGGTFKIPRGTVKQSLETVFQQAAVLAASGERVRFPFIGSLVRKDVKARKAGKGVNPFTGEPMVIKARPATKKPRWSFPKTLKETFANKRYW